MCQQSGDDTNDDIIMKLLMINTSPFFIGRIKSVGREEKLR